MRRNALCLLICFAVALLASAQDDCSDQAIMAMKGSWKKRPDANMQSGRNQAHINLCLDSISKIFQSACPELKGVEAAWYRSMSDPVIPGGPTAYIFNSLYLPWYCNKNLHKMMLSDETGTWAYVFVNSFGWFLSNQYDQLGLTIDGANAFLLPLRTGSWKGYDCYQPSGHGPSGSCILLTRGNRRPFKPVSQQQYLRSWRSFVEDLKKKAAGKGASGAGAGAGATAGADKMNKYYDDKVKLVDDYLGQTSQDVLGQPALIGPGEKSGFEGHFSTEAKGGRMAVTIDPDYFSKQTPGYVPQMMVLYWRWGNDAVSQNFKKQFEADFPVEQLNALLDHPGK